MNIVIDVTLCWPWCILYSRHVDTTGSDLFIFSVKGIPLHSILQSLILLMGQGYTPMDKRKTVACRNLLLPNCGRAVHLS